MLLGGHAIITNASLLRAPSVPVFQQKQIARAVGLGLGIDSPQKISLITGDAESEAFAEDIRAILSQG